MTNPTDLRQALGSVPMFSRLSPEALEALAQQASRRTFEAGDVVARNGEPNDGLLVVAEGSMEVHRGDRLYARLGPGGCVGDMSLIDGEPHMVDVVVTEPGWGAFLSRGSFRAVIRHDPEAAITMMETLVSRIREVVEWLEDSERDD